MFNHYDPIIIGIKMVLRFENGKNNIEFLGRGGAIINYVIVKINNMDNQHGSIMLEKLIFEVFNI
jgi:hypothetical protein